MKTDYLKIISVLVLIFGIINLLIMVQNFLTSGIYAQLGISWPMTGTVAEIVLGVLMIVVGAIGSRGVSGKDKFNRMILFHIILIVVAVIGLVIWIGEVGTLQAQVDEVFTSNGVDTVSIGGVKWSCYACLVLPVVYLIVALAGKKSSGTAGLRKV